jgi:hypothetical protein
VPHNLISAEESPVQLPKFQMDPRFRILISSGSQKGPRIYYPFFPQKVPSSEYPPGSPTGPYGERYPLAGHFYVFLNISLIVFLSEYPVREPPPCSLTGSPWTGIPHHQSQWQSEGISGPNTLTFSWETIIRNFQRRLQQLLSTVFLKWLSPSTFYKSL